MIHCYFITGEHRCDNNRMTVVCDEYPKTSPYNYTSNSTSVVIAFESDGSVNRRGFLLRFRGIPDPVIINNSTNITDTSRDDGTLHKILLDFGPKIIAIGILSVYIQVM